MFKHVAALFVHHVGFIGPAWEFGKLGIFVHSASPTTPPRRKERGTPEQRLGAVGVVLIGVLGATGAYTTLRAIGKRTHAMHSLVGFSALCVLVSSVRMAATRTPFIIPHRWDFVLMLFAMGVFGFIAQTLLTMGLQRETAGRGTLAVYIQIVFVSILERIFFHFMPSALSIVGNLIILSSALYVTLTKSSAATPATAGSARGVGVEQALAIEEDRGFLSHADTVIRTRRMWIH
ncbi:hypothetical protein FIBSPDRAFT_934865 [Athelia psychrophila]|uniref:EamA domain-containing protein n=1 Tax=Athelia psychrophila TaxID=1759441 RepID=A0A166EPW9_9AGAM|nr:hypothetical protein FIBSPDRAFT_934865 [Fibularhizoctonia sp. CBS 109695]